MPGFIVLVIQHWLLLVALLLFVIAFALHNVLEYLLSGKVKKYESRNTIISSSFEHYKTENTALKNEVEQLKNALKLKENSLLQIKTRQEQIEKRLNSANQFAAEHKEKAEAVALSRQVFFKNLEIPVVLTNHKGVITEVNPAAEQLLAQSRYAIQGKCSPTVFIRKSQLKEVAATLSKQLKKTVQNNFEVFAEIAKNKSLAPQEWHFVTATDKIFSVKLWVSIIKSKQNQYNEYLFIIYDKTITSEQTLEIEHAYRSIQRANIEIEKLTRQLAKQKTQKAEATPEKTKKEDAWKNNLAAWLSTINNLITNTLTISYIRPHDLVSQLYNLYKPLVTIDLMALGIYDRNNELLQFYTNYENSQQLPAFSLSLSKTQHVAVQCFSKQENIFADDLSKEEAADKKLQIIGSSYKSIVYFPLTVNKQRIGVLGIQAIKPGIYHSYHRYLLHILANSVSVFLLFRKLNEQKMYYTIKHQKLSVELLDQKQKAERETMKFEKQAHFVVLLNQLTRIFSGIFSFDELVEELFYGLTKIMDAAVVAIGWYHPENKSLDFVGRKKSVEQLQYGSDMLTEENRLSVWCFLHQKPVIMSNYRKQYREYVYRILLPEPREMRSSVIYLPLTFAGKKFGVITVQSYDKNAYSQTNIQQFTVISELIIKQLSERYHIEKQQKNDSEY